MYCIPVLLKLSLSNLTVVEKAGLEGWFVDSQPSQYLTSLPHLLDQRQQCTCCLHGLLAGTVRCIQMLSVVNENKTDRNSSVLCGFN